MAELIGLDASLLQEGESVVGERGVLLGQDDIATVLDVFCAAAGDDGGDVFEFVSAAEIGAVANNTVVEEAGAIAIFCFLKSVDEVGEESGAFFIALAGGFDTWLGEPVVAKVPTTASSCPQSTPPTG